MVEILREVGAIARALDSISNVEFKDFALTKGQYLYLVRICEHPGIIQERVGEMLKVERTTVTRAVARLEADGLVEKRRDPDNRKIRKLYPTAAGLAIYPRVIAEHEYSLGVATAGFTATEMEQLAQLLVRVRQNIEVDWRAVQKGTKRNY